MTTQPDTAAVRLATISAEISEYLAAETDVTRPGFHATALTHRIAPLLPQTQVLDEATDEQRAEVTSVVGETIVQAHGYLARGRSSMPIEVDVALILAGIAANLLFVNPTPQPDQSEGAE